jgi:uncharacterized membrane protein
MRKSSKIVLALIILTFIIGIYFYSHFPDQVASHWNTKGEVDGYMSKFWGLFIAPFIMLGMWILFILIPKMDPLKENIEKFRKYYDSFIVILTLFLFYIFLLVVIWNGIVEFNMTQAIVPAIAILFYYIGGLMSHMKRNWFIGIRTPWTLSNDKVWEKTHSIGGKLFKAIAVIIIIGLFFPNQLIWFVLVPVIASVIYLFVYSYFEYKRVSKDKNLIK